MIPVKRLALDDSTLKVLSKRQTSANKLWARDRRIQHRWEYFLRTDAGVPAKNRSAADAVRRQLDAMFHQKCCYCEKIITKDIEHFYPKTLYPNRMFQWTNLLRSCKDCNFEKRDEDPDVPLDSSGRRTLLDPTVDRPEDYLRWDLLTGEPVYVNYSSDPHRGKRTVLVCGLDNQKLNEQRRQKALWFQYLLENARGEDPVRPDTRNLLENLVSPAAPWLGVVRQILLDPANASLVGIIEGKIPELTAPFAALRWTHPAP